SPFSPNDVTVYTNCDSVKLLEYGLDSIIKSPKESLKMPHPPLVFKDVFHFMQTKDIGAPQRNGGRKVTKANGVLTAIGYAHGKEVLRAQQEPAGRSTSIKLKADLQGMTPIANGSFIIPIFAEIQDDNGHVKRLNNKLIHFEVEGEGILIGRDKSGINPHPVTWGSAPASVRTTLKAGAIKVIAHVEYPGTHTPAADTLTITSVVRKIPSVFEKEYTTHLENGGKLNRKSLRTSHLTEEQKKKILKKVGHQQTEFMQ